jgi:hypothetical protein
MVCTFTHGNELHKKDFLIGQINHSTHQYLGGLFDLNPGQAVWAGGVHFIGVLVTSPVQPARLGPGTQNGTAGSAWPHTPAAKCYLPANSLFLGLCSLPLVCHHHWPDAAADATGIVSSFPRPNLWSFTKFAAPKFSMEAMQAPAACAPNPPAQLCINTLCSVAELYIQLHR